MAVTKLRTELGASTLPPTPSPGRSLTEHVQAVSVWTRKAQQILKQFEDTLVNLNISQIAGTTDNLPEGTTNLYFTTARARASISATAPILYDAGTGVISLDVPLDVQYGGTGVTTFGGANRILFTTATDVLFSSNNLLWNDSTQEMTVSGTLTVDLVTINGFGVTNRLVYENAGKTLTAATVSAPLVFSSGTLSIPVATSSVNGYLSSTDWTTFNNKLSSPVNLATQVTGTLPGTNGGTGLNTGWNKGALLLGNVSDSWSFLNSVATGNVLLANGVGNFPVWGQVNLTSMVTGTLPATNGGTGQSTVTTGDLLYGSASNVWSKLADVATGNALISGGVATAPSWGKIGLTTHVSGTLAVGNGGTGTTNRTLLNSGASVTVDWENKQLSSGGVNVVDWANSILYDGTDNTLDWANHLIYSGNVLAIDWGNRSLNNSSAAVVVDWESQSLRDGSVASLLWGDRQAYDGSFILSLDYGNRTLSDNNNGIPSVDWQNRQLLDSGGLPVFDWNTTTFSNKITALGGIDPPYVLYDAHTRQETKDRVLKEIPKEKQTGAALFWNPGTKRLEVYVASEDVFYSLTGEILSLQSQ